MKKNIMLITHYFSLGNTGNFLIKALTSLGYSLTLIDPDQDIIPSTHSGLTIVWSNYIPGSLLKYHKHKILFYLDSDLFWRKNQPINSIENIGKGYDDIYTIVEIDGYKHLPFGCDPDIHKKIVLLPNEKRFLGADVSFIGTIREDGRLKFIEEFVKKINDQFTFKIWGNNWKDVSFAKKYWREKAMYFNDFSAICSSSKIVLQIYYPDYKPFQSNSTKDFEVTSVGGALYMINDTSYKVKEIFPKTPMFKTPEEAIELCKYYLNNEKERIKIVEENKIIAQKYTYEKQIKKVLDNLKW